MGGGKKAELSGDAEETGAERGVGMNTKGEWAGREFSVAAKGWYLAALFCSVIFLGGGMIVGSLVTGGSRSLGNWIGMAVFGAIILYVAFNFPRLWASPTRLWLGPDDLRWENAFGRRGWLPLDDVTKIEEDLTQPGGVRILGRDVQVLIPHRILGLVELLELLTARVGESCKTLLSARAVAALRARNPDSAALHRITVLNENG